MLSEKMVGILSQSQSVTNAVAVYHGTTSYNPDLTLCTNHLQVMNDQVGS